MARTYQYVCRRCSFDTLSGGPVYMCPHCGGDLQLLNIYQVEKHAEPQSRRFDTAMDDVMRGLDDLLREHSE